ncbi:MAG: hypothetical protein HYR80_10040, partial [Nitrospirae bacterium]|nr:hypothetical protein [Nitrospirota bacterium]
EKGKEGLCADGVCLGKDGKPQISVSGEGSLDVNGQKVVQAQGEACLGVKTDGSAKDKLFEYSVKVKLKILKYIDKDVVDLRGDLGKGDDLYKGPNNPTASPNSSQINKSNNYDPNSGEILE